MKISPFIYDRLIRPRFINERYLRRHIMGHFTFEDKRILDFGCGTGCNSFMFLPSQYLGVDIDRDRISYAKRVYRIYSFIVIENGPLPFRDTCFDIVFICGVLHHMSSNECLSYIREFKRILRPSGAVIILEPCYSKNSILSNAVMKIFDDGPYIRSQHKYLALFGREFVTKIHGEFRTPNFYSTVLFSAQPV